MIDLPALKRVVLGKDCFSKIHSLSVCGAIRDVV